MYTFSRYSWSCLNNLKSHFTPEYICKFWLFFTRQPQRVSAMSPLFIIITYLNINSVSITSIPPQYGCSNRLRGHSSLKAFKNSAAQLTAPCPFKLNCMLDEQGLLYQYGIDFLVALSNVQSYNVNGPHIDPLPTSASVFNTLQTMLSSWKRIGQSSPPLTVSLSYYFSCFSTTWFTLLTLAQSNLSTAVHSSRIRAPTLCIVAASGTLFGAALSRISRVHGLQSILTSLATSKEEHGTQFCHLPSIAFCCLYVLVPEYVGQLNNTWKLGK